MACPSVPLWFIFLLQALLVCGAFAALIIMMNIKFNEEYTDAVHERLVLSQQGAANKIRYRYASLESMANNANKKYLRSLRPLPYVYDNSTVDEMMDYFSEYYIYPESDPDIEYCYQNRQSDQYPIPGLNRYRWTFAAVDATKYSMIVNGSMYNYFDQNHKQPWRLDNLTNGPTWSVDVERTYGYDHVGWITSPFWSSVVPFQDPFDKGWRILNAYFYPFDIVNKDGRQFARRNFVFVVGANVLLPAITEAMASNDSTRAAVFSLGTRFGVSRSFITGRVDFPLYNEKAAGQWFIEDIPDERCRDVFLESESRCKETDDKCREPIVFEYDGQLVGVTIVRSKTLSDLLLFQYTPREFFYEEGDRTRRNGILIGVFAAFAVILSCVLIWLAIKQPLRALQHNMDLAADMRNDEVVTTSPILSEITTLTRRFTAMNNKLLAARPFLPQSLLQGNDEAEEEAQGGEVGAEDDLYGDSTRLRKSASVPHRNLSVLKSSTRTPSTIVSDDVSRRALNPGIHLMYRRAAVFCMNVRNFIGATRDKGMPPEQVAGSISKLLGHVQVAAQSNGGIVDYFHGDRFICTFNAAKVCGSPGRGAAACAENVRTLFHESACAVVFPRGLAMGLSVGRALVGNMGTDTMKRFSTVGAVFTEAMALQDTMRLREDNSALFMGTALPDIEHAVLYEVVGVVPAERLARGVQMDECLSDYSAHCNQYFMSMLRRELNASNNNNNINSNNNSNMVIPIVDDNNQGDVHVEDMSRHVIVALVRRCSASATDTEWMYELQDIQSSNPYKASNTAFVEYYLCGKTDNIAGLNIPKHPF